jgi:hypothetical protein
MTTFFRFVLVGENAHYFNAEERQFKPLSEHDNHFAILQSVGLLDRYLTEGDESGFVLCEYKDDTLTTVVPNCSILEDTLKWCDEFVQSEEYKSMTEVTANTIKEDLQNPNRYVRMMAVQHPLSTFGDLMTAAQDSDFLVKWCLLTHESTTSEHLQVLIDGDNEYLHEYALKHSKSTKEQWERDVNHKHWGVAWAAKKKLFGYSY